MRTKHAFQQFPMMCCHVLVWALLCGVLGVRAQGQTKPPARTELEGTWDADRQVRDGVEREYQPSELWMKFVGSRMTSLGVIHFLEPVEVAVVIDSKASPKQLDFPIRDVLKKCIYQLNGDNLVIALPLGTNPRPTSFESDKALIVKLHRRKGSTEGLYGSELVSSPLSGRMRSGFTATGWRLANESGFTVYPANASLNKSVIVGRQSEPLTDPH